MKFTKVFIVIIIAGLLGFVYLFIPSRIVLSGSAVAHQSGNAVIRGFKQLDHWGEWLPAKDAISNTPYINQSSFKITASSIATVNGQCSLNEINVPLLFAVESIGRYSAAFEYEATLNNKFMSPWKRITNYFLALTLKKELNKITNQAANYYSTTKANYGFEIIEDRVKDSLLVTTEKDFTDTPSTAQVYSLISEVAQYVEKNNGLIQGYPMVNVTKLDKTIFTQVGLPIQKQIPTNDKFLLKKMVLGNILKVKVVGDQNEVNKALLATENYIHDNLRTSPAMPFVKYANNRLLMQDASKWVSFIYYPIY